MCTFFRIITSLATHRLVNLARRLVNPSLTEITYIPDGISETLISAYSLLTTLGALKVLPDISVIVMAEKTG